MKQYIKTLITHLTMVIATFSFALMPALVPATAYASNIDEAQKGVESIGGDSRGNRAGDLTKLIESVINILLFVIGIIAVIMIIVGGIRYTTSAGDQSQITGAKNTILYSIIGLVVAIMAYALVNFVLKNLN